MRIRMKVTTNGSRDGAHTERFEVGDIVDLGRTARELELAAVMVREGWAEALTPAPVQEAEEKPSSAPQAAPAARPAAEGKRKGK
jgi:hypothetical protein